MEEHTKKESADYTLLLRLLLDESWAEEALYLSSPGLHAAWQSAKDKPLRLEASLETALWRYIFRSYGRATPFGLFAGVGMGVIGINRLIEFGVQPWHTVSRPDISVLNEVVSTLAQDSAVRPLLQYSLNNSVYEAAGQYRFSEVAPGSSAIKPKIDLSSLLITDDLKLLVDHLRQQGPLPYTTLITLYGPEYQAEVEPYINNLIDTQFLVSNLSMPVTGVDMTTYLLDQLSNLSSQPPVYQKLLAVQRRLSQFPLSLSKLGQQQQQLQQILGQPNASPESEGPLIQTDLFFHPTHLTLESTTILTIANQFSQLLPILTVTQPDQLQDFISRFRQVYDKQEVDLLTALDPEVGIGFTADALSLYPLLTELPFPVITRPFTQTQALDALRESLYSRFILNGLKEQKITLSDINEVALLQPAFPLPPAWYLHGELFNDTVLPLTQAGNEYRFVINTSIATSPAFLLGRFCHGHESLNQAVKDMCAWEQTQYPGELLAEIVHLPLSPLRAGNVVSRPILRSYEIPYITPPGVPAEQTILLSDLLISVTDNDQVILTNKKTRQRVRPRHSSAHNPALGDEIYQFLTRVQQKESTFWGWSWGPFSDLPVLPRLVYQNVVLSPAQWTIKKETIATTRPVTIETLRALFKLPRYVQLVEGDNKLLLDLDFEPAQAILVEEIKKQNKVLLKEWLGETLQPWLSTAGDQYVSELVIPLKTKTERGQQPEQYPVLSVSSETQQQQKAEVIPQRNVIPGGDWLYLKVYLHEQVADQVLINLVQPIGQLAQKKGWSTSMFFVRYADPDTHLRLRYKTTSKNYTKLLAAWYQALVPYTKSGLVKGVQLDTYQRELERYRSALQEDCETIFGADSRFYIDWLTKAELQLEENRYALALVSIDALLDDFAYSLPQKAGLCLRLQQTFLQEQGGSKELRRKLNELYRDHQTDFFLPSALSIQLTGVRSREIQSAVWTIKDYFLQTPADTGFEQLVASLLHMAMNRIFQGHQRRHELVVYHFLARRYKSLSARTKEQKDKSSS